MNYSEDIKRSVEFIEARIKEKLTPEIISSQAGYSLYHYCRVFQICMGLPVMEYIRKRRLSLAAVELFKGRRITDAALDFGFETPSGFTRAFRKEYGFTPTQYCARMAGVRSFLAGDPAALSDGGPLMKPEIVSKPAFKVAGYGIRTNIADGTYTKDIPAFWNQYDTNGWECKMYTQLNPPKHGEVGICVPDSVDSGGLIYLLGVVVEDFGKVTPDMIELEVPEATYAVFITPPVDYTREGTAKRPDDFPKAIRQTWRYIFEEWFKDSGYEYAEGKMDFEYYDERCHFRPDTVMEIWVPVVKKQ
jgi:AraC family transcriptional regulator